MKHKVRIRRRDGIRQRYWKNYGSKLFRDQIEHELFRKRRNQKDQARLYSELTTKSLSLPTERQKTEMIKAIEKNPDLLKPLENKKIFIFKRMKDDEPYAFTSKGGPVIISDHAFDKNIVDYDEISNSHVLVTPATALKHEVAHIHQHKLGAPLVINKKKKYLEVAPSYAVRTDVRKEKTNQRIMDKSILSFFEGEDQE